MAIFTRLKASIKINKEFTSTGIIFSIQKNDELVPLPVQLTVSDIKQVKNLDTLLLMEDLFYDQRLIELERLNYLLEYKELYHLEADERELLNLPDEVTSLFFKLDNKGIIGRSNFELNLSYRTEKYPKLDLVGKRYQNLIQLNDGQLVLMTENDVKLINAVHEVPYKQGEELLRQISKIKHLAKGSKVELNEYLTRENYEFIEGVEPDVERGSDGIQIIPSYSHDELDEEVLNHEQLVGRGYVKQEGKRVFVDEKAKETALRLNQIERIEEKDIPRFIENPESFIPEDIGGISLENFGERVKKLGIQVYKAQPFVYANENERGWFDYNVGYNVQNELGEQISQESLGYFETEGNYKKVDNNTYVSVPNDVNEFEEYASKIKNERNQGIHSNYVIEIFENIQSVEFNAPLQEFRQQLEDSNVKNKIPPKLFKANLHPFQEEGFVWMKHLHFIGYGGLLADDMGLGKTVQVIAFLSHLKDIGKLTPTLLVLPKSLIENWKNEMHNFAPELTHSPYVHIGANRLKDPKTISHFDIVLTTYDTLVRDQIVLGQIDWEMVISDEAQKIKNPSTSTSRVIKALKNKGRIALTGTPVENNLTELWSIVDFVQPGLLGSLNEFKKKYESAIKNGESYDHIQSRLEEEMKLVFKRRTKKGELENQLPKKIEHQGEFEVQFGPEQEKMYQSVIHQIKQKDIAPLQGIQELKKISSHPGLYDRSYSNLKIKKVPKLKVTMDILKNIHSKGEKALIFTEYREMQSILKRAIVEEFKLNAMVINGSTDSRQDLVDQFNKNDGFDVLILSPKAAGVGLTITSANHVIHYTRWWNPAVENQATDRAYRIGQEKDVHVYYPTIKTNVGKGFEELVDQVLSEKKELAENVIVPSKNLDIEEELQKELIH
ncbi:DEAD/DEAH box helicase [Filobacillus milosensis]|uniref:DEAD/DEAH box helicase n=1 Tax=Filobacillus milosensis TaxID=94137 RepID=A0A4Y8ICG3_9BACI|nr:DEAD/DEAH box helicase [Filobacillus milosensis]TFB13568.1 DEAD/DEAH box helicase [Filobacillus milosensis]